MKSVFIFLSALISISSAGVGVLSPQDETNALQLFHQICSQTQNGAGGTEFQGYTVFCKRAREEEVQEEVNHQVIVPNSQANRPQVVFVQPPSVKYQHQILLTGSPGSQQSSKIYVLPQKATHQIAATFNPGSSQTPAKPVVYFLSNKFGQQQQHVQPPQYGPPIASPPPTTGGGDHGHHESHYGPPPIAVVPPPQAHPLPQYGVVDVSPQHPSQEQQGYAYPHPPVSGGGYA